MFDVKQWIVENSILVLKYLVSMLFGLHVLKILYFTQLMQLSEKLVNME
jgi:hypothetical protein